MAIVKVHRTIANKQIFNLLLTFFAVNKAVLLVMFDFIFVTKA